MSYTAARREMQDLADEINRYRQSIKELLAQYDASIVRCVEAAEKYLVPSVEERSTNPTARKVSYETHDPSPEDIAKSATPKRKCSECGEEGHTKPTCPNLHEVREKEIEEKAKKPARKVRRKK